MVTRVLVAIVASMLLGSVLHASDLTEAIKGGNLAAVRELLEAGADPNAPGEHGNRPLLSAIMQNQHAICIELLEAGADPSLLGETTSTALQGLRPDPSAHEAIRALAQAGLDFSKEKSTPGVPLVARAIGNPETIRVLGEAGADPDVRGMHGKTALHLACEKGDGASIQALLEIRADPFARDEMGTRPISSTTGAQLADNPLIELYIDRAEESEDVAQSIGIDALMIAAYRRDEDAIQLLLNEGHPVTPGWYVGPTALQCLLMSPGDDPVALTQLLLSGARQDRDRVLEQQIRQMSQGATEEIRDQMREALLPTLRAQPEGPELGVVLSDLSASMTIASSKGFIGSFKAILEYGESRSQFTADFRLSALRAAVDGAGRECTALAVRAIGDDLGRSSSNLVGILSSAVDSGDEELAGLVAQIVPPAEERTWSLGSVVNKAVARGWSDLVVTLLDLGEDPNGDPPARPGRPVPRPISAAAASGNLEIVELLFDRGAVIEPSSNLRERGALLQAVEQADVRVFLRLLEHVKASPNYDPETRQELLNEALFGAATSMEMRFIDPALEAGARVDPESYVRCALIPPLKAGRTDLVNLLCDTFDLGETSAEAASYLYFSSLWAPDRIEMLELLRRRGLALEGKVGRDFFASALNRKRLDAVKWLIDSGIDLTTPEDEPFNSPLLGAAWYPELLEYFCERKPEIVANEGESALFLMLFMTKNLEAADILIEAGVRWKAFDADIEGALREIENEEIRRRARAAMRGPT